MIMNYKLGRMWKKVVVAYFKILFQHLAVGVEGNHEKLQNSWLPG
jgi:hypothetical protein